MDIQTIKTFMHVAKTDSFSKTAEELNYAQSTVTMQIQRLEKELGFPLFDRIGRKNYLTIAGKEFLNYAENILCLAERASSIGKDFSTLKGTLRIGVLESLLFAKLLPVLHLYRSKFSNLEINIKIGQTSELKELLRQNKLDIIYVSTDEHTEPDFKCCYKKKEELVFLISKNHPLLTNNNVTADDIFSYPFIVTEPTGYCYRRLCEIANEYNCQLHHDMIVDSVSAITSLVHKGLNIAFLPKYSLGKDIDSKSLMVITSNISKQYYYSKLLCSKEKWISPFIEELISDIKNFS